MLCAPANRRALGYGMLRTPIWQNPVHLVAVHIDDERAVLGVPIKGDQAVAVLPLNRTFTLGYGMLLDGVKATRVVPSL